jgi:hypothetical protein
MIEGRNEKENEKRNKEGSDEGNGRKNQCWVVLVFTLCYENLIGSLIYIYIYIGLMKTDQVPKIFIFSKFTRFSNRPVLAYMITSIFMSNFHNLVFFFRN